MRSVPSAVGLSCCCQHHPMPNQAGLHCQWLLRTYLPVMLLVPCKAAKCLIKSANRLSEVCNTISLLELCSLQACCLFAVTCHAEDLHAAPCQLHSRAAAGQLRRWRYRLTAHSVHASWKLDTGSTTRTTPHHVLPVVAQFSKQAGSAPQTALPHTVRRRPLPAWCSQPQNNLCCCNHHHLPHTSLGSAGRHHHRETTSATGTCLLLTTHTAVCLSCNSTCRLIGLIHEAI